MSTRDQSPPRNVADMSRGALGNRLEPLNLLCFFCNTRHRISGALVRPDSKIHFVIAMTWLVYRLSRSRILKRNFQSALGRLWGTGRPAKGPVRTERA